MGGKAIQYVFNADDLTSNSESPAQPTPFRIHSLVTGEQPPAWTESPLEDTIRAG